MKSKQILSFLLAFLISVIIFLVERLKACSVKATVLKATSSLFFVILACVAVLMKPENSDYGMMFIIGMVLCTIGDIWLDLKYVHKEFDEQYTFVGIGSFMVSHIFYLVGILLAYPEFAEYYGVPEKKHSIDLDVKTVLIEELTPTEQLEQAYEAISNDY